MKTGTILVFGGSIIWGAYDLEYGGWVERLRIFFDNKKIKEKSDIDVYNLGVSGDATEDLLKRFEVETKARLSDTETIIVFSIGINDSQFIHSKNDWRITPEGFKENLKKLITLAQRLTTKIICVELTNVDEAKTNPIPWNIDKSYRNERIQEFNNIIKSVAKDNNIAFIETAGLLDKEDLEDGLHPNSTGHKKIFEGVKDYLVKNKIIA